VTELSLQNEGPGLANNNSVQTLNWKLPTSNPKAPVSNFKFSIPNFQSQIFKPNPFSSNPLGLTPPFPAQDF
jgi:hypothetical protein